MDNTKFRRLFAILIVLLIITFFISLSIGRYSNDPLDVLNALFSRAGWEEGSNPIMDSIVFHVRMPRIIVSMLVGAMLSLSGAVYQGVFKNPLISPDLLGVSSGASVGAALAIMLGASLAQRQITAFLGGLLAVSITAFIPKLFKNRNNMMLVLSGIIVSGFFCSLLSIMKFVAEEQTELASIVFWQMGSMAKVLGKEIVAITPVFIICTTVLLLLSWRINILSFGDLEAKSLGMNITQIRGIIIVCASLLTASSVSISGTIGWIGLVIPHLGRLAIGTDNTKVVPITVVMGALFMLVIDTLARTVSTAEIPLSILTGFVGAPLFAYLLYKQKTLVE